MTDLNIILPKRMRINGPSVFEPVEPVSIYSDSYERDSAVSFMSETGKAYVVKGQKYARICPCDDGELVMEISHEAGSKIGLHWDIGYRKDWVAIGKVKEYLLYGYTYCYGLNRDWIIEVKDEEEALLEMLRYI